MNHPVERGDERRTNERRRSFVEHFLQDGHRLIAAKRHWAVKHSNRIAPTAKRSARRSIGSPVICSEPCNGSCRR
jgi:hypothetical protein